MITDVPKMKRITTTLLSMMAIGFTAAILIAAVLPTQNADLDYIIGAKNETFLSSCSWYENPHSGKYCIKHNYKPGYTWNVISQNIPIKCKPDTWYRLTIYNRNTVKSGAVYYGGREIYSNSDKSILFHWHAVALNTPNWKKYSFEFKTNKKAAKFQIYTRVSENVKFGEVFWDDIMFEEIDREKQFLMFNNFPAAATYVNAPLLVAEHGMTGFRELDVSALQLTVQYKMIPSNSVLKFAFNGKTAQQTVSGDGSAAFDLKLNTLKEGRYIAHAAIYSNGKLYLKTQKTIIRLKQEITAPLPAVKKVTAGPDRNLYVNGKPFIPVYFSHVTPHAANLKVMRTQHGVNISAVWDDIHPKKSDTELISELSVSFRQQLDACKAAGIYGYVSLDRVGIHKNGRFNIPVLKGIIEQVKAHPALIFWGLCDEPDARNFKKEDMIEAYTVVKAADPNHPVWVNLCNPSRYDDFKTVSDFASYDQYFYPQRTLVEMHDWTETVKGLFSLNHPLIVFLQTYGDCNNEYTMPPYEYLRASFYLSLVQGTKSIFSYSWYDPPPACSMISNLEIQSYMKSITHELRVMSSFITAPSVSQPEFKVPSRVKYLFKKNGLLLVNIDDKTAAPCSITIPGAKKLVDVFGGSAIKSGKGGEFKLDIEPFGTRFFRFQ